MLTKSYNSTVHSATKFPPNKIDSSNEHQVFRNLYDSIIMKRKPKPRFKLNQIVRTSVVKSLFEKGYRPNWTKEEFIIRGVQDTDPPTYLLKDKFGENVTGGYYEPELMLVNN